MRKTILVLVSAIACFILFTACSANNSPLASSQESFSSSGCKVWEVARSMSARNPTSVNPQPIETGWEPFAFDSGVFLVRRCAK